MTKIRTNEGKVLYARQPDQLGQVIEPRHVAMMNTMMQETLLSGTARKAEIPGWTAAGKTGTSQDFRDAWFIGYTANLVTGVWLGNDDNSPTKKATGGGLPVEVWTRFMRAAHQGVPVASLPKSQAAAACSRTCSSPRRKSARPAIYQHRRCSRRRRSRRSIPVGGVSSGADAHLGAAQSIGAAGSGGGTGWLADGPGVRRKPVSQTRYSMASSFETHCFAMLLRMKVWTLTGEERVFARLEP